MTHFNNSMTSRYRNDNKDTNKDANKKDKKEEFKHNFTWATLPGSVKDSPVIVAGFTEQVKKGKGVLDDPLFDYLSLATPSRKEAAMIPLLKKYIPGLETDALGNAYVVIGGGLQKTMFSCHIDTVHNKVQDIELRRTIGGGPAKENFIFGVRYSKSLKGRVASVLGADDRLGMYIMTRLIANKVPGIYVFHVQEESGGAGSVAFASRNRHSILRSAERCIAFDRKDYGDIITRQRGEDYASDEFAKAFAEQINPHLPKFQKMSKCTGGVFTDSANYGHFIPECVNISVGYFQQHFPEEHFDAAWLQDHLLPGLLKMDFDALPVVRDPSVKSTTQSYGYGRRDWQNEEYGDDMYGGNYYGGASGGTSFNRHSAGIINNVIHVPDYTRFVDIPLWEVGMSFTKTTSQDNKLLSIVRSLSEGKVSQRSFITEFLLAKDKADKAKAEEDANTKAFLDMIAANDKLRKEKERYNNFLKFVASKMSPEERFKYFSKDMVDAADKEYDKLALATPVVELSQETDPPLPDINNKGTMPVVYSATETKNVGSAGAVVQVAALTTEQLTGVLNTQVGSFHHSLEKYNAKLVVPFVPVTTATELNSRSNYVGEVCLMFQNAVTDSGISRKDLQSEYGLASKIFDNLGQVDDVLSELALDNIDKKDFKTKLASGSDALKAAEELARKLLLITDKLLKDGKLPDNEPVTH